VEKAEEEEAEEVEEEEEEAEGSKDCKEGKPKCRINVCNIVVVVSLPLPRLRLNLSSVSNSSVGEKDGAIEEEVVVLFASTKQVCIVCKNDTQSEAHNTATSCAQPPWLCCSCCRRRWLMA
jgi:hypothetical protein